MTDDEIEQAFAYAAQYDSDLPIFDAAVTLQEQLRAARAQLAAQAPVIAAAGAWRDWIQKQPWTPSALGGVLVDAVDELRAKDLPDDSAGGGR